MLGKEYSEKPCEITLTLRLISSSYGNTKVCDDMPPADYGQGWGPIPAELEWWMVINKRFACHWNIAIFAGKIRMQGTLLRLSCYVSSTVNWASLKSDRYKMVGEYQLLSSRGNTYS